MSGAVPFIPDRLSGLGRAAEVWLLPERAVFWPAARTLLVADLHWGKCETFRAAGAPLPQGLLEADLDRLESALRSTEASRLMILGDLLHASVGITDWLVQCVAMWRRAWGGLEIVVVPGNHDRRIAMVADAWGFFLAAPTHTEGPFLFVHDPGMAAPGRGEYAWAGHIHPMALLRGRGDSIRLPAFHLTPTVGVLPAFSAFTDGVCVSRTPPFEGDVLFAASPGGVIRVP